ncbi:MAG TPA: Mur ligase family protein [Candidatus Limnocylindria bacterium]|nr:Mur ligase family protein [Candidatus Limnocylindria bacterium]
MQNFAEVHRYLSGLMSETRSRRHAYTLERMKALTAYLGNPQDSYPVIHVAGTSGKSSTCHYLSSLLTVGGKKVGLSISPHVDEVNERVQINTRSLGEKKFCRDLTLFLQEVDKSGVKPTYFELLVAFAFWEFAREKVDYAVVEVGLGGLLDGTNVMTRSDKVCVITDIGYDHTDTLGKTLTAITAQKAGIILPTNVVFAYNQVPEVMDVLREVCDQQQARLHELQPPRLDRLPKNLPLFQRRNWHLAHRVYDYLAERDSLTSLDRQTLIRSTEVHIPARMEVLKYRGKTLILDGGHNPQKLGMLMKSVVHAYPRQSIACTVAFVRTKQTKVRDNLSVLVPHMSHCVVTGFSREETEHFSVDPLKLVAACEELDYHAWELEPDPARALQKLLARPEDVLLVTGSFFLLNTIRPLIMNHNEFNDTGNRRTG